jgi:hypothetical protein
VCSFYEEHNWTMLNVCSFQEEHNWTMLNACSFQEEHNWTMFNVCFFQEEHNWTMLNACSFQEEHNWMFVFSWGKTMYVCSSGTQLNVCFIHLVIVPSIIRILFSSMVVTPYCCHYKCYI